MGVQIIDFFGEGEAITESLHNARGIELALVQVLEPVLAREPDKGQRVYALIEAMSLFHAQVATRAERITRGGMTG